MNEELIARAKKSFALRDSKWRIIWEDIWELVAPERNRKSGKLLPHEYGNTIHDSTAAKSAKSLADTLMTGLTPPWTPWFQLAPGALVDPKKKVELAKGLEAVNRILLLHFNTSNFIQELQPSLLDCIVGTGCIMVEPNDDSGVRFRNIPIDEIAIEENYKGEIDTIFHDMEVSGRTLIERWGSKLENTESYEKDLDRMVPIWVIVTPDDKGGFRKVVMLADGNQTLEEGTMKWNPYVVFRWNRMPGEPYGVGPAMDQYFDIRWLNKLKEMAGKGIAMDVGGIYTAQDDNVIDVYTARLQPDTIIPVMSNDRTNPSLAKLNTSSNINVAQFAINELRADIRKGFFADRFSPPQGEKFTATEVVMRSKAIAQEIGATYSILERELLRTVVIKVIDILIDQKIIDKNVRPDAKAIDIVYLSSLAQAQREGEVEGLLRFLSMAQQASQMDPASGLVPNAAETMREIAFLLQISPRLIRSEAEVLGIVKQAQQAEQQGLTAPEGQQLAERSA